jgi:hypothetical protein
VFVVQVVVADAHTIVQDIVGDAEEGVLIVIKFHDNNQRTITILAKMNSNEHYFY